MTTESSTYTYDSGAEETVTLKRGTADPHGHALLKIEHSSGLVADCYVDLAWLRDRADHLARQRPEGAEELGELIGTWTASEDIAPAQLPTGSLATLADFLAERGVRAARRDEEKR